jgi:hypothetical protein
MQVKMIFGVVHVEASGDAKECFRELASAAEVFGQSECGKCKSKNVLPSVREIDGNTYYEMKCNSCGCCLGFGQRKADGALFPRKRKDENWLPNGGWIDRRQQQQQQNAMNEPF